MSFYVHDKCIIWQQERTFDQIYYTQWAQAKKSPKSNTKVLIFQMLFVNSKFVKYIWTKLFHPVNNKETMQRLTPNMYSIEHFEAYASNILRKLFTRAVSCKKVEVGCLVGSGPNI